MDPLTLMAIGSFANAGAQMYGASMQNKAMKEQLSFQKQQYFNNALKEDKAQAEFDASLANFDNPLKV